MTEQSMPEMKTINGRTYVKVKNLAEEWDTTTSTILATGKPQQIPSRFRRTIDRQAWVSVEGLAYRLNKTKGDSNLVFQLKEFLQRFPEPSYKQTGPLMETVHEKNGGTTTIYRSSFQNIDAPSSEELQAALENRQIIYRYKNDRIQVLAQTLSSFLDTRTSSLLAVNKKQGVPGKFIHRAWKRTWIDLEGLKQRVQHTEHGSVLLKGLNWVVEYLDGEGKPFDQLVETMKQFESARASAKPTAEQAESDYNVAVEANKRAVHNTERLNKLDYQVQDVNVRAKALEHDVPQLLHSVCRLEDRVDRIEAGDKKATQLMAAKQTPLDALNKRVSSMVTHANRLDAKTGGLESRVSVLEDTSKWLSWSLATVLGVRLLGLTLHWLRRK